MLVNKAQGHLANICRNKLEVSHTLRSEQNEREKTDICCHQKKMKDLPQSSIALHLMPITSNRNIQTFLGH